MSNDASLLIIACGALAHEITALIEANRWQHVSIQCLPAELHNRPEEIPGAVQAKLNETGKQFDQIFMAYADCGTGGMLDKLLEAEGIERLPGAHCYEFFAGTDRFAQLHERELGTFYLTDFLVRHFDRLVIQGLGLDRYPELHEQYFENYHRFVYLSQGDSADLLERARGAAAQLGLEFEHVVTGYGQLEESLIRVAAPTV
ncbi:MAG: hypothetical protein CL396_05200 [Acidiferrobacteraceae bacterium]|jgi:hypothetical protein|nr:hypothetical protein [Acidiferrobacteraceae bacterium]